MFEDLCDRAGELKICMATATESDSARGIEMEVPDDDEEMAPMSSEPRQKPHQPETEEPIFYPREEFHKYKENSTLVNYMLDW